MLSTEMYSTKVSDPIGRTTVKYANVDVRVKIDMGSLGGHINRKTGLWTSIQSTN